MCLCGSFELDPEVYDDDKNEERTTMIVGRRQRRKKTKKQVYMKVVMRIMKRNKLDHN